MAPCALALLALATMPRAAAIQIFVFAPDELQQAFSPRMIDAPQRGFDGSLPATTSRDAKGRERVDLGDGLVFIRLAPGANGNSPVDDDAVSLEYRAFTRDGDEYASSRSLGPLNFTLGGPGLIPGLARAVRHMTLGERVLLWLPRQLLYPTPPQAPFPPDDALIFDVSLRRVGSVEAPMAGGGAQ
ncbi:unnamed protein product [Prorocentrum cordatum]|uniref:peptidylprolyl isomerase n=1 Tax=Prorocentrum cordatum TaxID=2364126 RepID=A0ABN9XIN7_9DINO|nr:unnamed protein product [Polarella glacialis]